MKEFAVVARIMDGNTVDGYIVKSQVTGETRPVTKGLLVDMINRKLISNCSYQAVKEGDVIFRGDGVKLSQLPSIKKEQFKNVNKPVENKVKATPQNNIGKLSIVANVKCGNQHFGYVVANEQGERKVIDKQRALILAKGNEIANARVQMNNGKELFRGYGIGLSDLPVIQLDQLKRA